MLRERRHEDPERAARIAKRRSAASACIADLSKPVGAMVELQCESAPVSPNEEFVQLANDLASSLATGPGATTADELLTQPSPSKPGMTLGEQKDDLFNRIREVFNVGRIVRIDGPCGGYSHNATTVSGVLLQVEGGNDEAAKDICMHIAAMRPRRLDQGRRARRRKSRRSETFFAKRPSRKASRRTSSTRWSKAGCGTSTPSACCSSSRSSRTTSRPSASTPNRHGLKIVKFVHWELGKVIAVRRASSAASARGCCIVGRTIAEQEYGATALRCD